MKLTHWGTYSFSTNKRWLQYNSGVWPWAYRNQPLWLNPNHICLHLLEHFFNYLEEALRCLAHLAVWVLFRGMGPYHLQTCLDIITPSQCPPRHFYLLKLSPVQHLHYISYINPLRTQLIEIKAVSILIMCVVRVGSGLGPISLR